MKKEIITCDLCRKKIHHFPDPKFTKHSQLKFVVCSNNLEEPDELYLRDLCEKCTNKIQKVLERVIPYLFEDV